MFSAMMGPIPMLSGTVTPPIPNSTHKARTSRRYSVLLRMRTNSFIPHTPPVVSHEKIAAISKFVK